MRVLTWSHSCVMACARGERISFEPALVRVRGRVRVRLRDGVRG